jgi:hypothetical protein
MVWPVEKKPAFPLSFSAVFGVGKCLHFCAKMSFKTEHFQKILRKFWKRNRKKVEKF